MAIRKFLTDIYESNQQNLKFNIVKKESNFCQKELCYEKFLACVLSLTVGGDMCLRIIDDA
jgi:hypothetical protein